MGSDPPAGGFEASLAAAGVRLHLAGEIATVTLAAPERRNAMTPGTWRALAAVGRALTGDIRVAIVRSEGPSFSAGLDRRLLSAEGVPGEPGPAILATRSDEELDEAIAGYQQAFTWWRRADLVSIAAVQGHAVGAGFQLALACDLRVLADDAMLAMREITLGMVPDLGGTKPLVDLVGYARALEICLTGRWIPADEARSLGIATAVVSGTELDDAVADLAAAILAGPRDAVIETKALLAGAAGRTYDEQRAAERAAQSRRLRDLFGASADDQARESPTVHRQL